MVKILMVEKKECKCRVELRRGAITLPAVAMPRIFISMLATDKVKDKDKSAYAMPMTSTSQNKALSIVNKSLS